MKNDDRDNDDGDGAALDPDGEPSRFQSVNRALNKFFATRHWKSALLWFPVSPRSSR